eukprot:UN04491
MRDLKEKETMCLSTFFIAALSRKNVYIGGLLENPYRAKIFISRIIGKLLR